MATIRALVDHIRHSGRRLKVGETVQLGAAAAAALVALGVAEQVDARADDSGTGENGVAGPNTPPPREAQADAPAAEQATDDARAATTDAAAAQDAPAAADPVRVRLNHASADELAALPHIGAQIARAIVAYRTKHSPFAQVDDLEAVPGIGKRAVARLRDLVTCT